MKNILFVLTFLFLSFAVVSNVSAATLSLQPASGSYNVGDSFNVDVKLDTQSGQVQGVDLHYIVYDPTLLELQDANTSTSGTQITPGSLMPVTVMNTVNTAQGKVDFSQITLGGQSYSGSGILATMRFKALKSGTGALTINFTSGNTTDSNVASNGVELLTSVTNGSYTLGTGVNTTPTTSSTPSSSSSSSSTTQPSSNTTPSTTSSTQTSTTTTSTSAPVTSNTTVTTPSSVSKFLPAGINEGDLVKGPDGIKIYIVNYYGYRRHIFNPAIFNMYGHFKWDQVRNVSQQTLDSLKISDFYRADGDYRVFSLKEVDEVGGVAEKDWMNLPAEKFTALGYSWDQVFIINTKERDYYKEGVALTEEILKSRQITTTPLSSATTVNPQASTTLVAKGSLIKLADEPTVYYITSASMKKPIINIEVFNSYNNKWANVKIVTKDVLDKYPTIKAIKLSGSNQIYSIENGIKHLVSSTETLSNLGIDPNKVAIVNQTEFDAYQTGEEIK